MDLVVRDAGVRPAGGAPERPKVPAGEPAAEDVGVRPGDRRPDEPLCRRAGELEELGDRGCVDGVDERRGRVRRERALEGGELARNEIGDQDGGGLDRLDPPDERRPVGPELAHALDRVDRPAAVERRGERGRGGHPPTVDGRLDDHQSPAGRPPPLALDQTVEERDEPGAVVRLARTDLEHAPVAAAVRPDALERGFRRGRMQIRRAVFGRRVEGPVHPREDVAGEDGVDVLVGEPLERPTDALLREDVGVDGHELDRPSGDAAARIDLGDPERGAVAHLDAVRARRTAQWEGGSDAVRTSA
jgi:hypothetical protein